MERNDIVSARRALYSKEAYTKIMKIMISFYSSELHAFLQGLPLAQE